MSKIMDDWLNSTTFDVLPGGIPELAPEPDDEDDEPEAEGKQRRPFARRTKQSEPRDGDGDGFVYDGTARMRPARGNDPAIARGAKRVLKYVAEAKAAPPLTSATPVEEAQAIIAAVWSMEFTTKTGRKVRARTIQVRDRRPQRRPAVRGTYTVDGWNFAITGALEDVETGAELGIYMRNIEIPPQGGGEAYVYHDGLKIEKAYQGEGIGSEFNAHAMAWYRELGIARIDVTAGATADQSQGGAMNGGYTWGQQGFDYEGGDHMPGTTNRAYWFGQSQLGVMREVVRAADQQDADLATRMAFLKHVARGVPEDWLIEHFETVQEIVRKIDPADPPTPYELGELGRDLPHFKDTDTGRETWFGQALQARSRWRGTFRLEWLDRFLEESKAKQARGHLLGGLMLAMLGDDGWTTEGDVEPPDYEPPMPVTMAKAHAAAASPFRWTAADVSVAPGMHPVGEDRVTLRVVAAGLVDRLEADYARGLETMWAEQEQLVIGRLRGRKARKHTRHWTLRDGVAPVSSKALDPEYVLDPDRVDSEAIRFATGIALHVGTEAAGDARDRLDADLEIGPSSAFVQAAIAAATERITGLAREKAAQVRALIAAADQGELTMGEIVERVEELYAERGAWADAAAKAQANALINQSALAVAKAAGVVTKQWLSSHDERVRPTHRVADGQVRHIEDDFRVGAWRLPYPGASDDWPASAEEVAQCRCTMLFGRPSPFAAARPWQEGDGDPDADELQRMFDTPMEGTFSEGVPLSLTTNEPLLAYRTIDRDVVTEIGQRLTIETDANLTMLREQAQAGAGAAQALGGSDVLVEIEMPAGTSVLHAPGSTEATIFAGATFEVVALSDTLVRLRLL